MKKILYSVFALTMAAFTFTSCEDVPAPYDDPNNNGGGQELPEGVLLDQSFTSSLGEFTSKAASGNLNWYNDYSSAMVTGFQDFDGDGNKENQAGVTFLVGPEIDLTEVTEAYITINHALNYERGDINTNNSIVISKDYAGDVTTATWQVLNYNTEGLNTGFTFTEKSVNIPSEYMGGKVVIALRHTCNESSSSTWEVKSLKVQVGKVEDTPEEPGEEGTYIDESFSSEFGSFTVKTIKGTPWIIDFSTAKATGYDNASKETTPSESYIVSSPVNLSASTGAYITFEYILRYVTNNDGQPVDGVNNKVYITDNYTGDPTTTSWTDITGTLTEGRDWNTWSKYSVDVPEAFVGKSNVVIALYYSCGESSGTWEVKNLKMQEGKTEDLPSGNIGDLTKPNGDFEAWVEGLPNNWSTTSTAGNATLSMSTDKHSGSYAVLVKGDSKSNKRISYKEMELKAGEYTMRFYAKAATAAGASLCPGYVQVTDGKVGSYKYGEYSNNLSNTEWIEVTHTFTIDADGTYCVLIMNSKNPGGDLLIDDFTLTTGETTIIE